MSPDSRIAVICNPLPSCMGVGEYLARGIGQVGNVQHFATGEETDGYDLYIYVDDGPSYYMEPKYRPAAYWAIDMVVQPFWYLDPIQHYFERCQNFDFVYVSSTATQRYCQERGMNAKVLGFGADPEYHRPHPVAREWDWVAMWHNCGDRIEASNEAYKRFPNGRVAWAGYEKYAEYICSGKCALNWLRGDIVNMRVFEVMACGTPLVTTRHPDMDYFGFVENEHYYGYEGVDEMLDTIGYVNEHPGEAEAVARNGMEFVLSRHTYYHRAMEIFNAKR